MSKGLIVCGYPGVGKSAVAGWSNCIDLESSFFRISDSDKNRWEIMYCRTAVDLAEQGYTVLTSTHESVIGYLKNMPDITHGFVKLIIFAPQKSMKEEWVERLKKRYHDIPTEKNKRALDRAEHNWAGDLEMLNKSKVQVWYPETINYNFRHYISDMQAMYLDKKEKAV